MGAEKDNKKMTFETALARLEAIVQEMEDGKTDLDSMLRSFEEGQRLVQFCNGRLQEVERKIEQLAKADGTIVAKPMNVEDDL
jgi:exodeoxyribonuclease VII small subunit